MFKLCKPQALAAAVALSFCAFSALAAEEVRVYNWSDYIAEDTLAKFTKETGIKVIYDVYDSNEVLEAALLSGRSGYDLVMPSNHYVARQISAKAFVALDHSKMPNMANLNPKLMTQLDVVDKGSQFSLPYLWGTNGYGYNEGRIQEILGDDAPVDSWALVFDPEVTTKLAAGGCGIAMLDSGEEMVRAAMAYIGLDPNSTSSDDIKKGGEVIKAVRPNITYFHSSRYIGDLANGDLCVAAGYSGDILQAAARAEEANNGNVIRYTIPKEGATLWFDMMTIPVGAPNADNAHKLMNFLMRPDIIAEVSNYVWYANPNLAANEFVDADILNDTSIYPTETVMDNLYLMQGRPQDAQRLMTRTWTSVKSGR
jgi:putrescine transport system substrate-binding protein